MTPDHYTYRTAAELLRGVRDHHRLSQRDLADRSGVAQAQLARYEKGRVEPSLAVLRRILTGVGWAPTMGVEPTTAAVDQQLDVAAEMGGPVLDSDVHLLLRVCARAGDAGARLVVGGEVAATLQGVPTTSTDLRVHVVEVLPAARVVESHGMRLHAVDLDVLRETGALAPATAALAARRAQRAGGAG